MERVLIISFSFEQEPDALKVLLDAGFDVTVLPMEKRQNWTEADLCDWMEKQDPAFTGLLIGADIALGEAFLTRCPQIRALSLNCAGSDHLDLPAFRRHEVPVCNVPRQNFNAVADFAWGLILSLMRRIPQGDAAIRAGKWNQGVERSLAVSGKTIGIIGFGAIGQAVARRAMGFDMRILVSSTSRNPETAERQIAYLEERGLAVEDITDMGWPLEGGRSY